MAGSHRLNTHVPLILGPLLLAGLAACADGPEDEFSEATGAGGAGGSGVGVTDPGSGVQGSGATGSGATGSGATGSGATGSGATGSGATGSGATGSGATGSGATGSGATTGGGGTVTPTPSPSPSGGAAAGFSCPPAGTLSTGSEDWASNVWGAVNDGSGSQTEPVVSGGAIRAQGSGFSDWGGGVLLSLSDLASCVDFSTYGGIEFASSGSGSIEVSLIVAGTVPADAGGTCTTDCYDYHQTVRSAGGTSTVMWGDISQEGWGAPVSFDERNLVSLQFSTSTGSFDFTIDDVKLVPRGTTGGGGTGGSTGAGGTTGAGGSTSAGGSTGSGGATSGGGATAFEEVFSRADFDSYFPVGVRNGFYTYDGLVEATKSFPAFANSGDVATRKREVAAFIANVKHETGTLQYIEEINPWSDYCDSSPWFAETPCAPGKRYYGRGPLQISWNYNYGRAASFVGADILARPELVAQNARIAWATALWFWMTQTGSWDRTPHDAIVTGQGFGGTIQAINGNLECGGAGQSKVELRVGYFNEALLLLGVSAVGDTYC